MFSTLSLPGIREGSARRAGATAHGPRLAGRVVVLLLRQAGGPLSAQAALASGDQLFCSASACCGAQPLRLHARDGPCPGQLKVGVLGFLDALFRHAWMYSGSGRWPPALEVCPGPRCLAGPSN